MEKALLVKLEKYCAYQERCHYEVRQKAWSIGIYGNNIDVALLHLIETNFLNENRFVELYVRSKINQKRWGPVKIKIELLKKKIEAKLIAKELAEIDKQVWLSNLKMLSEKYCEQKKLVLTKFNDKTQLTNFLLTKGYQFDMINSITNKQ